ncbi:MAG: virginiamycin B lyase family protein [Gemmatimonadota bacterium]
MMSAAWSLLLSTLLAGPAVVADAPADAPGLGSAETPAVASAPASDTLDLREWDVPWEDTRPRDPYVRDRSRVWFVGQRGDYVAYLDPSSDEFERFDLDDGTGPHNLIVAEDGTVWYAGNRAAHIGTVDPSTGEITKYPMPDEAARDPHTLVFGQDDDIWFTVQGGNFVGRLDRSSGDVQLVEVPTEGARPYGIKVTADNRPWIVLLGTNKLATVDPETMELREIEMPRPDARPRRMAITSDEAVWYVDYAQGYLGRYDPSSGDFEEWRTPAGADSRPYGMAKDAQDRLWFVETGVSPNQMVGFDPETETFAWRDEIPSGGGTVRHMNYYEPTGEIWFGADTNTIGRLRVP